MEQQLSEEHYGQFTLTRQFDLPDESQEALSALEELITLEMEFNWKKWARAKSLNVSCAEPPRIEDYLKRYPVLNSLDILIRLVHHEHSVRCQYGDHPAMSEYRERFPQIITGDGDDERFVSAQEMDTLAVTTLDSESQQVEVQKLAPMREGTTLRNVAEYEIVSELGRGSWGIVFKAQHRRLGHLVALKILAQGKVAEHEARAFEEEARALASSQHEGIVWIHDCKVDHSPPFIAMEFVPGGTLHEKIRNRLMTPQEATEMMIQLARAVQRAHDNKIIHRDLKPANVLLTVDGKPKIADFGLARRLDQVITSGGGGIAGTPSYMAPEQVRGETIDERTDVYALGAILYELLTGRPPFLSDTIHKIFKQVQNDDPVAPGTLTSERIPADLEAICLKCLNKSPKDRYASAEDLAEDLGNFLQGRPTKARPASFMDRAWKWIRRNPWPAACTFIFALVLMALVAFIYEKRIRSQKEKHAQQLGEQIDLLEAQFGQHRELLANLMGEAKLRTQGSLEHFQKPIWEYYDSLIVELKGRPRLQKQLAQAYRDKGILAKVFGETNVAESSFQQAQLTYNEILKSPPADADSIWDQLALCHVERGLALEEIGAGQPDEERLKTRQQSKSEYETAGAILQKLTTRHPDNDNYQLHLAEVHHNLAIWYNSWDKAEQANPQRSIEEHQKALVIREKIAERSKSRPCRRDLARSHGYVGDVYIRLEDAPYKKTKAAYDKALEIRQKLVDEDDNDDEAKFQLARSFENNGRLFNQMNQLKDAIREYATACDYQQKIVKRKPGVLVYQRDYARTSQVLADVKMDQGDFTDVETLLSRTRQIYNDMVRLTEGEDKGSLRRLAQTHVGLAKCYLMREKQDCDRARECLEKAQQLLMIKMKEDGLIGSAEQYQLALLHALYAKLLRSKTYDNKRSQELITAEEHEKIALKHLEIALKPKYAGTIRNEARRDVALRELRSNPEFQRLLKQYQ